MVNPQLKSTIQLHHTLHTLLTLLYTRAPDSASFLRRYLTVHCWRKTLQEGISLRRELMTTALKQPQTYTVAQSSTQPPQLRDYITDLELCVLLQSKAKALL